MNYVDFRFEVVVDWVEILVTLPYSTQFRYVQDRLEDTGLGRPFITVHGSRGAANVFSFRVQDPKGPANLLAKLQCLCVLGGPALTAENVAVMGVELALDVYHHSSANDVLSEMAAHLFFCQAVHAPSRIGLPRLCTPFAEGVTTEVAIESSRVRRHLARGWTIRDGEKGSDFEQGWYVKCHDSLPGAPPHAPLPAEAHRARAEVTLRGARLPFLTLEQWRNFDFKLMTSTYFSWRAIKEGYQTPVDPQSRGLRLGMPLPEHRAKGRRPGSHPPRTVDARRKNRPGTIVDAALRRKIKNALARLTRDQAGT